MKRPGVVIVKATFAVLFLLFAFTATEAKAASNGTVTVPVLNVRSGPGTGYKKIDSIKSGQTYSVLASSKGWYKLQIGGVSGWVSGEYLKVSSTPSVPAQKPAPSNTPLGTVKVTADVLNVRQSAALSSNRIGSAKTGETYKYFEKSGVWYKIKYGSSYGWVHGGYVATIDEETAAPPVQPQPQQPVQPQQPSGGSNGGISVGEVVVARYNLMAVRSDKTLESEVIGRSKKGSTYTVLESDSGWLKIQFESRMGWIRDDYVTSNSRPVVNTPAAPVSPVLNMVNEIGDIRIYNTDSKNSIAIPVTLKVSKLNSTTLLTPDMNYNTTGDGRLLININNSIFNGTQRYITANSNQLVSAINVTSTGNNTTSIDISMISGISYEVSNVPAKSFEDDEYRYLSTYIVVSLKSPVNTGGGQSNLPPGRLIIKKDRNSQGKTKGEYLIALDAGHGGSTSGACSGGYQEKTLVYDITMKLNDILKAQGYDTYLTRDSDKYVSLSERADSANILKADVFVSIHLNSYYSKSSNGTETLYNSQAKASGVPLAQTIQRHLVSNLGRYNRGIIDRPELAVLNSTHMPAALAEIMFMSNSQELKLITQDSVRQNTAQAIADAVNEYFGF